jgi:hypothetical protein
LASEEEHIFSVDCFYIAASADMVYSSSRL